MKKSVSLRISRRHITFSFNFNINNCKGYKISKLLFYKISLLYFYQKNILNLNEKIEIIKQIELES